MASGAHKHRTSPAGALTSYIHLGGMIGLLVEVGCESEFVARSEDFQALIHDIAMHIAASNPRFIRKEDVTQEAYERERAIYRSQAEATGKPPQVVEKIVEGEMSRFYERFCLNEQPFIKDQTLSVQQLIGTKAASLGEEIAVRRFSRFKVGEGLKTTTDDLSRPLEGGDEAGIPVKKPKGPKSGSGFAAAKFGEEIE